MKIYHRRLLARVARWLIGNSTHTPTTESWTYNVLVR